MIAVSNTNALPFQRGKAKKNLNALTGAFLGAATAAAWGDRFPGTAQSYATGFLIGALWANAAEYLYHRFLSHVPGTSFHRGHLQHHATQGTPEEPEHISFGGSVPKMIVIFLFNCLPVAALDWRLHWGILPGYVLGLTIYFILGEEVHWRIHMGGWLPPGLRQSREYHFAHHDRPESRFNIFLPLFDWLLGTERAKNEA